MRYVEHDGLAKQHHAHPLVEPVVHLVDTADISTYLPVDTADISTYLVVDTVDISTYLVVDTVDISTYLPVDTVDISTYLVVDTPTCSSSPESMVPTPGWMAVAGRGSVKVAWVQQ